MTDQEGSTEPGAGSVGRPPTIIRITCLLLVVVGFLSVMFTAPAVFDAARTSAPPGPRPMSKVPEVTAVFWITKVLTTVMGETTSDFFAHRFSPYLAVALGGAGLVGALALQFRAGGLAVGTGLVSLVLAGVIAALVAYLAVSKCDVKDPESGFSGLPSARSHGRQG